MTSVQWHRWEYVRSFSLSFSLCTERILLIAKNLLLVPCKKGTRKWKNEEKMQTADTVLSCPHSFHFFKVFTDFRMRMSPYSLNKARHHSKLVWNTHGGLGCHLLFFWVSLQCLWLPLNRAEVNVSVWCPLRHINERLCTTFNVAKAKQNSFNTMIVQKKKKQPAHPASIYIWWGDIQICVPLSQICTPHYNWQ